MRTLIVYVFFFVLFQGCNRGEALNQVGTLPSPGVNDWLIPRSEVRDGGPGKDGIPAIGQPNFADISEITYLHDEDLVIVLRHGNITHIYPHQIMDWHEIVNDNIGSSAIAVTYCPLTGTTSAWNRIINGRETSFGVSGLIYNSNLIPYDRRTNSNWSQMQLECVNGEWIGTEAELIHHFETSWKTAKGIFNEARVLTRETGFARSYGNYPYHNYRETGDLIFPVSINDYRLHPKERVLGVVIEKEATVYRFSTFSDPNVVKDSVGEKNILLVGSQAENFILVYEDSFPDLDFSYFSDPGNQEVIMKDNEGNLWDIFGKAVEGPRVGASLIPVNAFMGYWFSWPAFYKDIPIYGE